MSKRKRATELEWLRYFYEQADFGPGSCDVMFYMKENFKEDTGKDLPEGYDDEDEE